MFVLRISLTRYAGDREGLLTRRSALVFRWVVETQGISREFDVRVRADNASERGVPLPKELKALINADSWLPAVDALAAAAVQNARSELAVPAETKLDCRRRAWSPNP